MVPRMLTHLKEGSIASPIGPSGGPRPRPSAFPWESQGSTEDKSSPLHLDDVGGRVTLCALQRPFEPQPSWSSR